MGDRHLTNDGFNGALIVGGAIDSKLFAQGVAFLLLRVHGQNLGIETMASKSME